MSAIIVARWENDCHVRFQCTWHVSNTAITGVTDASTPTAWKYVDIVFKETSRSAEFSWPQEAKDTRLLIEPSTEQQDFGSAAVFGFVLDCLSASSANPEHQSVARLIVPQSRGYIPRSDIIPLRMLDCPLVTSVVSFSEPHQFFSGDAISLENGLSNTFAAAAGGMLLKHGADLSSLDGELSNRLSFPWLSTLATKRLTLAIVDGGISGPEHGGTGGKVYTVAEALGIDMVVFDSPNHWVNDPRYSHWRKDTVPLECLLEPDAGFTSRIVDAVRSYEGQIDGIVTFRDHYKLPVSQAAQQLGLPTCLPLAYEIATDKFKTSVSEGHHAYCASDAEQAVKIVREHNLMFPLIIKPTNGFLSEGVFRVENLAHLEAGVNAINTERHGKEFVIEKYCEGPEVDANFVLCDKEVLFFEVSDDFPKTGDINGQGSSSNKSFIELANVLPSKLPDNELAILKNSLQQSLIRMGFQDGFYHLEARVENSSMEYATKNHVLDLTKRSVPTKGEPSAWLIEVNPRPPGIQASEAVRHTYGIDYIGLALLFALEDKHRVKQLSHPFAQGPQYWCEMVFIPVEKGGVFDSGDVCEELFERRPDLAANVSVSFCFKRRGDAVQDPSTGVNSWVAYFNVFSRESRAHVLELADRIREEVKFSIV